MMWVTIEITSICRWLDDTLGFIWHEQCVGRFQTIAAVLDRSAEVDGAGLGFVFMILAVHILALSLGLLEGGDS